LVTFDFSESAKASQAKGNSTRTDNGIKAVEGTLAKQKSRLAGPNVSSNSPNLPQKP